jgi:hypothetical protein
MLRREKQRTEDADSRDRSDERRDSTHGVVQQ